MNSKSSLPQMIGLTLVVLLLVGCGASKPASTPTLTSIPTSTPTLTSISTSTPTSAPTSTPTSTPTNVPPTPTPLAGIGEPVAGNIWQVTVKDARQETKLSESSSTINLVTGMLTASVTTYSPTSGYTFLVVKTTFRNLDPAKPKPISAEDVTVLNEDGTTFIAIGGSSDDEDYCVRCPFEASIEGAELTLSFVFEVDHSTIDQDFLLQIKDVPPILFSVPNP